MKKINLIPSIILSIVFLTLLPSRVLGQNIPTQVTFHVVDDSSNPISGLGFVEGAFIITSWNHPASVTNVSGITDSKGNVTLSLPSENGQLGFGTKYGTEGYYGTHDDYHFENQIGGKWQPWNPTVKVVVKPILNPIAMYARDNNMDIPAKNTPVGFDLIAADWVVPYGKGTISDFIFTMTEKIPFTKYNQPYDLTWTLSFPNKGDGIQSVIGPPLNQGSALRLPRYAPEAGYESPLVQQLSLNGNKRLNGADGENQNYFFRVRTVLDESGKIKSALYGKIAGPIQYWGNSDVHMMYYLNPTPNDRNMEFDPKKNLFKNLSDLQQVNAP